MGLFTRFQQGTEILSERGWKPFARETFDFALLRSPLSSPLTQQAYWKLSPTVYRWLYETDTSAYRAPLDPFKIEFVSPDAITRITARPGYPVWADVATDFGRVVGGDWDWPDGEKPEWTSERRARTAATEGVATPSEVASFCYLCTADRFSESIIHRSMEDHFRRGTPWEETEAFRKVRWILDESDHTWGGRSKREVLQHCEYLDDLYERIRRAGYRTQRELAEEDPERDGGLLTSVRNEILVDVGRDGELLFVDGRHRLSIAKLLDLDRIPVAFVVRHPRWMEHRDEVYENGGPTDHPDLRELRDR